MRRKYFDCLQEHDDSQSLFEMISKLANNKGATTAMVCFEIEHLLSSPFMFTKTKLSKLEEASGCIDSLINEINKSDLELVKRYISKEIENAR